MPLSARTRRTLPFLLTALVTMWLVPPATAQNDGWRTIEFETTEVSWPDVAVSRDGEWLVFTMLGHLFRLPVEGGTAEQLTFGPYYDSDLVLSPDDSRVAFVSDRDGSQGNVFVLELATGEIAQVTHESWVGRPAWTPDGQAIVYLRFERIGLHTDELGPLTNPALVRKVAVSGGEPETLADSAREFRSVFHLPDGRLAWTVIELPTESRPSTTRIETLSPQGVVSTLRTLEGYADRVVPGPMGDGLYCRCRSHQVDLLFHPLPTGAGRTILPLRGQVWPHWWEQPRFAVAADGKTLYVGNGGRLWKIVLPSGEREPVAFTAHVTLEVREPTPPRRWALPEPGHSAPPRSIRFPRLSPDGRRLVFTAARHIWEQPLDGGPARRLSDAGAIDWQPAFSPDGRQVAFLHESPGTDRELRVIDLPTGRTRTVSTGVRDRPPNWTPDGKRLIVVDDPNNRSFRLLATDLTDGTKDTLAEVEGDFLGSVNATISLDGRWLYFVAQRVAGHPSIATVFRLSLRDRTARAEPVTQLALDYRRGRVSPDGRWFAFQARNHREIRVVPLGGERVTADNSRLLTPAGNQNFAFTHDGSAVVYANINRVWRHPLDGGQREEIPVRLELERPTPPPVLLRRVRLLDFVAGGFGSETSLLIHEGRIQWIGAEGGRQLPGGTVSLDAAGRYAIPGLFDTHVHGGRRTAFVPYGVTSVRQMGQNTLHVVTQDADRSAFTSEPVPRWFYAGYMLASQEAGGVPLNDADDARALVRRLKASGVHFIKDHALRSGALRRAVAAEARRQGLPVVGHGVFLEQVTKGVTLGYASLTHALSRYYDDVFQMLLAAGITWEPTLVIGGGAAMLLRDEPERLADAKLRAFASDRLIRVLRREYWHWKELEENRLRGYWVDRLAEIRAAHRRGVKLLVGSDAPARSIPIGVSLHWELEHFADAGIPPLDVLRIATQQAAEAVGAGDDLGTLEVGKLADIVLLDANPLEDIKNTQAIWRVIKGGFVFDPEELRPDRN